MFYGAAEPQPIAEGKARRFRRFSNPTHRSGRQSGGARTSDSSFGLYRYAGRHRLKDRQADWGVPFIQGVTSSFTSQGPMEGEAPAEPKPESPTRLGGSLALHQDELIGHVSSMDGGEEGEVRRPSRQCDVCDVAAGGFGKPSAGGDAVGERDAIAHMAADEEPGMLRFRLGHGVKEALVP